MPLLLSVAILSCAESTLSADVAASDVQRDTIDGSQPSQADTVRSSLDHGIRYGYFAVHLDPGSLPFIPGTMMPNPSRGMEYFDALAALVEAADASGHKLTLMFTAQWAAHVLSPTCRLPGAPDAITHSYQGVEATTCLQLVRAFEKHGHEIGVHHHPQGVKASWDGFTNEEAPHPSGYLGTVDDLMTWVGQVPVDGSDSVRAGTLEEYPVTHAIRFTGARGPTPYQDAAIRGDLVSQPCAWNGDGSPVWRFRMRLYTKDFEMIREETAKAVADFMDVPGRWTLGFVAHAKDVDGALSEYETLFSWLSNNNVQLEGLTRVAAQYDWTTEEPHEDSPHVCPADEAI
ncbi:MAG: hypothetical protein VX223_03750 [Myxococcota bacterium]|nr:hypothetical protein [Myxococcota bacterium]